MSQNRILKAETIVPDQLYVEREADRQLNQVVSEMGRPGYILDARQMGKTNLLLHMKRHREALGDLVLYFDFTNKFESARGFFRSVVTSIVDREPEQLGFLNPANRPLIPFGAEAHIEYDRDLRAILKALAPRHIVLIFDEVDSLISVPYADTVFGQIRAMYFNRASHSEFQRLTYVLAGVAEPTELIKDKKRSPFNIGEKIYLNDFSNAEFQTFLEKAQLDFSPEVRAAIYNWASGNPRMTWDICADLEDRSRDARTITTERVEATVRKLFLDRFDRPPVDHIRTLVESDPQICSAIRSIKLDTSIQIDEGIRKRLYLAGVTRGTEGALRVRNRILDLALSEEWLSAVAAERSGMLQLATEKYAEGKYDDTVQFIERYIRETKKEPPFASIFQMGVSKYFVGRFSDAIPFLRSALSSSTSDDLSHKCQYYLGAALFHLKKFEEASNLFRIVAEQEGPLRWSAMIGLGGCLLSIAPKSNFKQLVFVHERLVREIREATVESQLTAEHQEILASAYVNLAQTYELNDDVPKAIENLDLALQVSATATRPAILLKKIAVRDDAQNSNLALEAATIIITNELRVPLGVSSDLHFSHKVATSTLGRLLAFGERDIFAKLLSYYSESTFKSLVGLFDYLVDLFERGENPTELRLAAPVLWHLADQLSEGDVGREKIDLAVMLSVFFSAPGENIKAEYKYFNSLPRRLAAKSPLYNEDFVILMGRTVAAIESKQFKRALQLTYLSRQARLEGVTATPPLFSIITLSQEMVARGSANDPDGTVAVAKEVVSAVDKIMKGGVENEQSPIIAKYRENALAILSRARTDPFKGIGRNQYVTAKYQESGDIVKRKFKQIEEDLRSGNLTIISVDKPRRS